MMRKTILTVCLALSFAVPAFAQNWMTVTATNIQNAKGDKLPLGQACLLPTLLDGTPTSFNVGGGGQAIKRAVCTSVSTGALSIPLPNTSLTNPRNVCLALTVVDSNNNETVMDLGYQCLQPSPTAYWCASSTCNLDNYIPALAPLVQVQAGPPGPQGPAGGGYRVPYTQTFTSATAVTILGVSHGYATTGILTACFDNGTPAHAIEPAQLYINASTYDVTILFARPQSGMCVINGGTGPVGPMGPSGGSTNWRGTCNGATVYSPLDACGYNGSSYVATAGLSGILPPSAPWQLLASIGAQGIQGPQGATGATGTTGPQGATGAQGPQGITGATGAPGVTGAQGPQGSTGPQGVKGDTGSQGIQGATGPANTLSVLSTTTLSPGANATVNISGAAPNQSLAFGIPQGVQGSKGDTGLMGPAGYAATNFILSSAAALTGYNEINAASSITVTLPAPASTSGATAVLYNNTSYINTLGVPHTFPPGTNYRSLSPHELAVFMSDGSRWQQVSSSTTPYSDSAVTLGGSALSAGVCSSVTAMSVSVTYGDAYKVIVSPQTYPGDNFYWRGYVDSSGNVVIQVCAATAGTPPSGSYFYTLTL